jgi:RimJ/RimL family protein N-acetyltransferase
MFELTTGQHIGCGGLRPYRPEEKIHELGVHLRPAFWAKGFATEAAQEALAYGIHELKANAIFAGHHPQHTASRNVLLKLGFQETGTAFYEPTGLLHPAYMFYPNRSSA